MLECLYLILDVDYMCRYLVSDFVETALSPSLSRSILYLHTLHSLIHTFTYLSMLTKFKVLGICTMISLCSFKLVEIEQNVFQFATFCCQFTISAVKLFFSFMINLYVVCMDFFRTEVEFWLVLLGPSTGKVLDSWCLFLISENKICWLDVYFNIQDSKHNYTSAVYSLMTPHPPTTKKKNTLTRKSLWQRSCIPPI